MEYTVYKERLKQLKCAVIIPTYNNEKTTAVFTTNYSSIFYKQ